MIAITVTHPTEPYQHIRFATEASARSAISLINALPEAEQHHAYYRGGTSETPIEGTFEIFMRDTSETSATKAILRDLRKTLPHRMLVDVRDLRILPGRRYSARAILGWRNADEMEPFADLLATAG